MTFSAWLDRYRNRDTRRGDLARDIARDPHFPTDAADLYAYHFHLRSRGACREALQTLKSAWNSYLRDIENRCPSAAHRRPGGYSNELRT